MLTYVCRTVWEGVWVVTNKSVDFLVLEWVENQWQLYHKCLPQSNFNCGVIDYFPYLLISIHLSHPLIHVRRHLHTRMSTHSHTRTVAYAHTHTHTHTHTCAHMHAHTQIHTATSIMHIHVYLHLLLPLDPPLQAFIMAARHLKSRFDLSAPKAPLTISPVCVVSAPICRVIDPSPWPTHLLCWFVVAFFIGSLPILQLLFNSLYKVTQWPRSVCHVHMCPVVN